MKKLTNEEIEKIYKDGCFVMAEKAMILKISRDCGLACVGLYNLILSHKSSTNVNGCYPSYETLMLEGCISSKATLPSYLSKLVDYGYIKIKSGNRGYSSQYYFPLAHSKISNYNDEDFEYIETIVRKKGSTHDNISTNSLDNLKNYKQESTYDFENNPFGV